MNDLLNNPAVQAGVAPFIVALAVAAALRNSRLLALALTAAFATVIALVMGFSFETLTSTRKMALAGLAAGLLCLPLELARVQATRRTRAIVAVVLAGASLWVVLRFLQQQEMAQALLRGAAVALFMAALVDFHVKIGDDSVRSASSALMLGLGTGVLALLGASAMLAQVGIAIGAGAGGVLLVQMIAGRRAPVGWTLALPAAVAAGLVGLLAVFGGALTWYALIPLLATPWATRLVPAGRRPVWQTAFLSALAALGPVLLAVAIAWATAGAPST